MRFLISILIFLSFNEPKDDNIYVKAIESSVIKDIKSKGLKVDTLRFLLPETIPVSLPGKINQFSIDTATFLSGFFSQPSNKKIVVYDILPISKKGSKQFITIRTLLCSQKDGKNVMNYVNGYTIYFAKNKKTKKNQVYKVDRHLF
jgi:hypothetical protein